MYGKLRDNLIANGYKPIPLNGKIPLISDWLNADPPEGHESANVGIVLKGLVAIDIDIDDPIAVEKVVALRGGALVRIGRAPRQIRLFRTDGHVTKRALRLVDGNGSPQAIEILGDGQQFCAFGIHPTTGKPFEWWGPSPIDVAVDWLPTITSAEIDAFLIEAERRLIEYGFRRPESSGSGNMLRLPQRVAILSNDNSPLLDALEMLDADDYGCWIAVGHALKAAGDHLAEFDAWSATSDKYPGSAAIEARWEGFAPDKSPGLSAIARASGVSLNKPEDYFQSDGSAPTEPDIPEPFKPILFDLGDEPITAPKWTVEDFLEEAAIGVLWGPPESKKTFLAIDWALHVAHGEPWLGQRCPAGAVWIIAGEGFSGIRRRIYGANLHRGRPASAVGAGLKISKASVHLSKEENRKRLSAHFNEGPRPRLIIIDTLSRNLGEGADENKATDVAAYLDVVAALAREMHVTVLIVHHSGKDGTNYRGSSAIKGNVDFEFELLPKNNIVYLKCHKMKDAAHPAERMLCTRMVQIADMPNQWGEVRPVTTLAIDGVTAGDLAELHAAVQEKSESEHEDLDNRIENGVKVVRLVMPQGKVSRNAVFAQVRGDRNRFLFRVTAMVLAGRLTDDDHAGLSVV